MRDLLRQLVRALTPPPRCPLCSQRTRHQSLHWHIEHAGDPATPTPKGATR